MNVQVNLLDALPAAVYTTDPAGRITYYNDAAAELWGHRPPLQSSLWCGSWRLYWPDGRSMAHDECPMAVMLKEGRAMPGVEAIAERPDGTRVWFMPFPRLIRDGDGRLTGALNLLVDITERRQLDVESSRLAAIVSSSDDAIVSKTLEGVVTSWNAGAERMFGYGAEEMIGSKIIRIIPPELRSEEDDILARLARGEHIDHYDTVRMRKNGQRLYVSLTVSPLRDRRGVIVGASKIARDITERKRSEEMQRVLTAELHHRVKNTLAVVQSIANQSLRRARDPEHFVRSLSGRIQALARAHTLLVDRKMTGSDLADVIREQVLLDNPDGRIEVSGPSIHLNATVSVNLSLVLHELSTNSRKYGSLSVPDGQLAISWRVQSVPALRLLIEWREHGSPNVSDPKSVGFGTSLIERMLASAGGSATMLYADTGLTCTLTLPLDEQTVEAAPIQPSSGASGRRRVVMLVEDEPLIAMDIEAEIENTGYSVAGPFSTVTAALQAIEQEDVDAAILDANLQGHGVDAVAAALRRKSVPFVFATGYGKESLPPGFDDAPVLTKPFGTSALRDALATMLNRDDAPSTVLSMEAHRRK
jgi:PAS domain S-box-containing protein